MEKILKAHVVKTTRAQPPYIHDLLRLAQVAALVLTEEEIDLLDEANSFNIRARYPEHKVAFYKTCTKRYAQGYLGRIIPLYKKLCRDLTQKKSSDNTQPR